MNNEGLGEEAAKGGPAQSEQWGEWGPQIAATPPAEARTFEPPLPEGAEWRERGYHPLPPPAYYPSPIYPPYGYAPMSYIMPPPKPRRDGYLLTLAIIATSGGSILVLQSLISFLYLAMVAIIINSATRQIRPWDSSYQNQILLFNAIEFVIIGFYLCGGGVTLYHGICSLIKKPSARFNLGPAWIWLLAFGGIVGTGLILNATHLDLIYPFITPGLAILTALLPAMALTTFSRNIGKHERSTLTWRRMSSAFTGGATISTQIATTLELFLTLFFLPLFFKSNTLFTSLWFYLFVGIAIPVIDLLLRTLMVSISMGRIKREEEALQLGLASGAGMGFSLALIILIVLSTAGMYDLTHNPWPELAIIGLNLVLMHGICGAFTSIGWYRLVHTKEKLLLSLSKYWLGALFIQVIIYITWALALFPPFSQTSRWQPIEFGPIGISLQLLLIFFETLGLLAIFLWVLKRMKLRTSTNPTNLAYKQASIERPLEQVQRQS